MDDSRRLTAEEVRRRVVAGDAEGLFWTVDEFSQMWALDREEILGELAAGRLVAQGRRLEGRLGRIDVEAFDSISIGVEAGLAWLKHPYVPEPLRKRVRDIRAMRALLEAAADRRLTLRIVVDGQAQDLPPALFRDPPANLAALLAIDEPRGLSLLSEIADRLPNSKLAALLMTQGAHFECDPGAIKQAFGGEA